MKKAKKKTVRLPSFQKLVAFAKENGACEEGLAALRRYARSGKPVSEFLKRAVRARFRRFELSAESPAFKMQYNLFWLAAAIDSRIPWAERTRVGYSYYEAITDYDRARELFARIK